jgi:hypothetical protein
MLRRWIWRDFANITLGVWLLSSPFTLGYTDRPLVWSDLVSGGLIVVLARSAEPALRQTAIILPARWSSRGR